MSPASWKKGALGTSLEGKLKARVSVAVAVCISVSYGVVYTGCAHNVHGTVVHTSSCKVKASFCLECFCGEFSVLVYVLSLSSPWPQVGST